MYFMGRIAHKLKHYESENAYYKKTIENFPEPAAFSNELREAGFDFVRHVPLTLGIANIHIAVRG